MAGNTDRLQNSRKLIRQAVDDFDAGKARYACQSAWWSVVDCIMALDEERDWELGSHVNFLRAASDVIAHTDDPEKFKEALFKAKLLYRNVDDDDLTREDVQKGIQQVRELLDAIDRVKPNLPMHGLFPSVRA